MSGNGFYDRLVKFAWGEDTALNGLFGGREGETLSGSVGRAAEAHKAWAPAARFVIEVVLRFGKGHCAAQAALEATQRAELGQ